MGNIKAGVVVVTKFTQPGSDEYTGYIDYIGRDEAIRNDAYKAYSMYNDYMGNPEKTTCLFTADKSRLEKGEKARLKNVFEAAQGNGSLMWQTVISFDNRWLEQNGLMDIESMAVDEGKLQEVTRGMTRQLQKDEGLEGAAWSAAIHYNTDNMHIHIAMVEPVPTRERGKFKLGSIEKAKSRVVNSVMSQQVENKLINSLIRDNIVRSEKSVLYKDKKLAEMFRDIHSRLPLNKQLWKYNMNALTNVRPYIDNLSREFIRTYHSKDYDSLMEQLRVMDSRYRQAYGESKPDGSFVETKLEDLYTRMGNSILRELKEYDKGLKVGNIQKRPSDTQRNNHRISPKQYQMRNSNALASSLSKLKYSLSNDYGHFKNQLVYERLEQKISTDY